MKKIFYLIYCLCFCGILNGATIIVDDDGAGDHTTIVAAIAAAVADDVIQITGGADNIHTESSIIINKDLTIEGLGQSTTILQAHATQGMASDRIFIVNATIVVTFQFITLRHGNATGRGGCILLNDGCDVLIDQVTITNNDSADEGGGIGTASGTSGMLIDIYDSVISYNNGGVANDGADGGGIYNAGGDLYLTNCFVGENKCGDDGGGVYISEFDSYNEFINTTIYGNLCGEATGSGARDGGGIYLSYGDMNLVNCTIASNESPEYAGGIGAPLGTFLCMTNTIIAYNFAPNFGSDLALAPGSLGNNDNNLVVLCDGPDCGSFSYTSDPNLSEPTSCGELTYMPLLWPSEAINGGTLLGGAVDDVCGNSRDVTPDLGASEVMFEDDLGVESCALGTDVTCADNSTTFTFKTVTLAPFLCDGNGNSTYNVSITPPNGGNAGDITTNVIHSDCEIIIEITNVAAGAVAGDYVLFLDMTDPDGADDYSADCGFVIDLGTSLVYAIGSLTILDEIEVQNFTNGTILPGETKDFSINIINTDATTTYDWTIAGTALNQMTGDGASTGALVDITVPGSGGNTIQALAVTTSVTTGVTQSTVTITNPADGITTTFDVGLTATGPCGADVSTFLNAITALPIELKHFRGQTDNRNVNLEWATLSEINNDYFLIERSFSGVDFEPIGKIKGAGNSHDLKTYSFLDNKIPDGINQVYYRLKQFDFDGTTSLSDILVFNLTSNDFFISSLISDQNTLTVSFYLPVENETEAKLFEINGREIMSKHNLATEGLNTLDFNIEGIPSGMYFIQLSNGEERISQKIMKFH